MKITAIALCLSLFTDKHNSATQDPNGATQSNPKRHCSIQNFREEAVQSQEMEKQRLQEKKTIDFSSSSIPEDPNGIEPLKQFQHRECVYGGDEAGFPEYAGRGVQFRGVKAAMMWRHGLGTMRRRAVWN
ncbi:hypothetical protein FCV25MIE_29722 [Fagus crenata]